MKYSQLAELYEKLSSTTKSLEKTDILAKFLNKLKKEQDKSIIYLLKGKIFPDYDESEIGISLQLTIKALSKATGYQETKIVEEFKLLGDLGKVAELLTSSKEQSTLSSTKLTAEKVLINLRKLVEFEGKGTVEKKISLIAELLTSASPTEAKYLARTLLGNLRIGIGEGVLRDAIVVACCPKDNKAIPSKGREGSGFSWGCDEEKVKQLKEQVQEAYNTSNDFALVFEKACQGKLKEIVIDTEKPLKVMLYPKADDFQDAFDRLGKPCIFEYKYDGFRMLIHKNNNGIKLFTRRLDNVAKQFPDVVKYVKENIKAESFIIDSEAIGYDPKTKKFLPFQTISQRIKRKYDIEKLVKKLPIEINVFDILYYNGENLIKKPFEKRHEILKKIIKNDKYHLKLAEQIKTSSEKEAEEFYNKALEEGHEGVMAKSIDAPYKPGSRIGYGLKIKPQDQDFDLVIVKAEYGTGKRAGWLTSYTVACLQQDQFLEIGKVSTGLKEKPEEGLSFEEVTKKLKPLITKENGREVEVKPKIVITVTYQNIQKSPTYKSGFALRFPRFTRLRLDRNTEDITTLAEIEKEYQRANN
ncbi:MAG: ATP-dependent DNA ligase [Nanoarchaeota archaeon]|nr:ATP-dependent DNA ligase [Nanoarchaeota archaeon]